MEETYKIGDVVWVTPTDGYAREATIIDCYPDNTYIVEGVDDHNQIVRSKFDEDHIVPYNDRPLES